MILGSGRYELEKRASMDVSLEQESEGYMS
jgi:hypothetical protein